jgi:hypothetical protein
MSKRGWFYLLLLMGYLVAEAGIGWLLNGNPQFFTNGAALFLFVWSWYAWLLAKRKFPDPKKAP